MRGEGLWFEHCRSIHTIGMRANIDVAFLDEDRRVLRIVQNVTPGIFALSCPNAMHIIEIGAGTFTEDKIKITDVLALETTH